MLLKMKLDALSKVDRDELYRRYGDDIAAETFRILVENQKRYTLEGASPEAQQASFLALFRRIATRLQTKEYHWQKRFTFMGDILAGSVGGPGPWWVPRRDLLARLEALPNEQRQALIEHDLYEKTAKEIARETGVAPGTIASRVRLARTALRATLVALLSFFSGRRAWAFAGLALIGGAIWWSGHAPIYPPVTPMLVHHVAPIPPTVLPAPVAAPTPIVKPTVSSAVSPTVKPTVSPIAGLTPKAPALEPAPAAVPAPLAAPEAVALPTPAPPAAPDLLATEAKLLAIARRLLQQGDPQQTLVVLNAYERQFPAGTLGTDATTLRAEALLAVGDCAALRALSSTDPTIRRLERQCR